MDVPRPHETLDDLFRRESGHLVAALVRLLGPSQVALAEDVVHDALVAALQAWRFEVPKNPKAWLLETAKNRAIDRLRRERRLGPLEDHAIELALSDDADAENQLATMLAICDDALSTETHVTLILRLLCGFGPAEIARAFLTDVQTIDRRLHRGRARLAQIELGPSAVAERQPSVQHALYLLFNEGYHGNDADNPWKPALCAEALRLAETLLRARGVEPASLHALCALFCFDAARLATRLDDEGVFVPLERQDRSRWDRALFERGIQHLGASASGERFTRYHLEAGIAFEHTRAPSLDETDWPRILELYEALLAIAPGPIVALNRALAVAEVQGLDAGRRALESLEGEPRLLAYSFYWGARADVERRSHRGNEARAHYRRAIELSRSSAERRAWERRLD